MLASISSSTDPDAILDESQIEALLNGEEMPAKPVEEYKSYDEGKGNGFIQKYTKKAQTKKMGLAERASVKFQE